MTFVPLPYFDLWTPQIQRCLGFRIPILTSFLPPHPSQRQRHSKVPTWSQPKAIFHQTLHQASSSSSAGAISSAESQRTSTWTSWRAMAWVVPSLLRSYQWSHQLSHLLLRGNSDPICSWAARVPTEGSPNPWRSLSPKIPWIPTKRLAVSKGQRQQRNDRGPHCEGIRPTLSDVWAHGAHLYGSDHPWCERCTFASKSPNEIGHSSGEPAVAISSCNWQLDRNMRYQTTAPSFFLTPLSPCSYFYMHLGSMSCAWSTTHCRQLTFYLVTTTNDARTVTYCDSTILKFPRNKVQWHRLAWRRTLSTKSSKTQKCQAAQQKCSPSQWFKQPRLLRPSRTDHASC